MELIILFMVNNACWLLYLYFAEKLKPRNNSKKGQQILAETEDINANGGTVKYHLRQAAILQQAMNEHLREADEIADIMQTRANHAKKAIG